MTKKKQKNKQKAQAPMPAADQQKEKEDELDMLEDIKRDEDLYISESDVSNISNFIRTTNKSFNSLGNTVVEKFSNRCSLAILHALLALFDLDSEDREDVIRRLNIIYIVWRLPDLEQQLRLKPTKTMNDVYSHPFATFLFYAEQLERHPVEATLARIIVTNNVNVVEKLTAPDFIQKAKNLNLHKVDREAFGKWTELNTDHWPEITEEMVSLSKAMRELGCYSERKEYEAGMAEAFYPLVHNPPTMLPPRMVPLKQEDPRIQKYLMEQDPHNKDAASVIYSQSVGIEMQDQLKEAFMELTQSVSDYQDAIDTGMTEKELEESRREIPLDGEMSESEDSDDGITDGDSDSDTDAETKLRQFADVNQLDEATMMQCISRILQGHTLTSKKQEYAIHFLRRMPLIHPTYLHLMGEGNKDENINLWCKTNPKFAAEFMCRHALTEKEDDTILFKRYLTIYESLQSALASYEFVVKISNEYRDQKRLTRQHQECVLNFVRNALNHVEEAKNTSTRSVRLVSMFIIKLLQGAIVTADDIASFVKPFCLKHTENRDCTVLYQMILDIQSGKGSVEEIKSTTTTTGTPSMMTTTTTTTSVNTNATSTTTTTTVIKQCGPAVIKQTSKKVVLSFKNPPQNAHF
uniref:CCR4-NOT transcription complex subunit 11 n=1 Tax=Caenorhabditis tropicalis TaxID=1561998 RepID=A0A1I7UIJ0_9PELO